MDTASDLSCKGSTGQHAVDSPRHCCIERSPRATASTSPFKDDRSWARSSGSSLSWPPSMKESLHFAGLPRHIPAQCNSAVRATVPARTSAAHLCSYRVK